MALDNNELRGVKGTKKISRLNAYNTGHKHVSDFIEIQINIGAFFLLKFLQFMHESSKII